jgi:hypothetical protein
MSHNPILDGTWWVHAHVLDEAPSNEFIRALIRYVPPWSSPSPSASYVKSRRELWRPEMLPGANLLEQAR